MTPYCSLQPWHRADPERWQQTFRQKRNEEDDLQNLGTPGKGTKLSNLHVTTFVKRLIVSDAHCECAQMIGIQLYSANVFMFSLFTFEPPFNIGAETSCTYIVAFENYILNLFCTIPEQTCPQIPWHSATEWHHWTVSWVQRRRWQS